MLVLILGLLIFLAAHSASIAGQKAQLVARFGAGGYKLGYSAISLLGLILIVYGYGLYRATAWVQIWTPPRGMKHLSILLMLFAFISIAAAYLPGEIKRRLKHPMLVGVKIWALAHLLANGDLGSMLLFGAFLAWAVVDRISLKRREPAAGMGIAPGWSTNDWIAVGGGAAAWAIFGFVLHPYIIGVSVLPG